jgi:hypothetical protein
MVDMQAQLVKLREQAAEFDRIASKATDVAKKELFARLADLGTAGRWFESSCPDQYFQLLRSISAA